MGLIDFVKSAGEKLFGHGKTQTAMAEMQAAPADPAKIAAANAAAGDAILDYIKGQNLAATGLTVTFDGATSTATVYGVADDQATKEKIILCCGNVAGGQGQRHDDGVRQRAAGAVLHGRLGRYAVEDQQAVLRRRQPVHEDLRS